MADLEYAVCEDGNNCTSPRGPLDLPMARKNWIDNEITDEKRLPRVNDSRYNGFTSFLKKLPCRQRTVSS